MKNFNQFTMSVVLSCTLFTACRKDSKSENSPVVQESNTQKLTGKKWCISAATVTPGISDGSGGFLTDFYKLVAPCDRDNYIIFKADGTLEDNAGDWKCNLTDKQSTSDIWSFVDNETKLNIGSGVDVFDIVLLDATNLKLHQEYIDAGIIQNYNITFTKK
jgi:hypothetical protein